jgi:hypothetical protein
VAIGRMEDDPILPNVCDLVGVDGMTRVSETNRDDWPRVGARLAM